MTRLSSWTNYASVFPFKWKGFQRNNQTVRQTALAEHVFLKPVGQNCNSLDKKTIAVAMADSKAD